MPESITLKEAIQLARIELSKRGYVVKKVKGRFGEYFRLYSPNPSNGKGAKSHYGYMYATKEAAYLHGSADIMAQERIESLIHVAIDNNPA